LTKSFTHEALIFKLTASFKKGEINRLEKIGALAVPALPNGLLTGGDIAPDGRRLAVCDYFSAYELKLPDKAKSFDDIWKSEPLIVELGERELGESVGYTADGRALVATSERNNSPIIFAELK
jgi:hypothetical protein